MNQTNNFKDKCMSFTEAVEEMQDGKYCMRLSNTGRVYKIKGGSIRYSDGCSWSDSADLKTSDYLSSDWMIADFIDEVNYGDVLYDSCNDRLLLVMDTDDASFHFIDENGCCGCTRHENLNLSGKYKKIENYERVNLAIIKLLNDTRTNHGLDGE